MMATIQFYRNPYNYPHYTENISTYGPVYDCTPVGMNLTSGQLKVAGNMDDFMQYNYMAIHRDENTLWAWIDDVRYNTANSFLITYQVDPWRTYKEHINLGEQFVERSPQITAIKDDMLGSSYPYPEVTTTQHTISNPSERTLVVQTRVYPGEQFSNAPVSPSPYRYYFVNYNIHAWTTSPAILALMNAIIGEARPENIVTMYSMPRIDLSHLTESDLYIHYPNGTATVGGFRMLDESSGMQGELHVTTDIDIGHTLTDLTKVDHSVQLVIPDAGIIEIPDYLLAESSLKLRQDIDIYSGAANYMLETASGYFSQSVRGSAVSSIPIISDPEDTYLSQNQNALATSMIGDVGSIVGGVGMTVASGGMAGLAGGGLALSGLNGITSRHADIKDAGAKTSNPPAFLGTALGNTFNGTFWVIVTKNAVQNEAEVHANFGYPLNMVKTMEFPTSGYIKTQGCSVTTTNGSVPRWAIEEINRMFDNGVLVH